MSDKFTFSRLILAVEMKDGKQYPELVITNTALVEWDLARHRHHWPAGDELPFLWMSYLAFHQLKLDGDYRGKWSEFQADVRHTQTIPDPLDPKQAKTDDVDPTTPEAEEDSLSE